MRTNILSIISLLAFLFITCGKDPGSITIKGTITNQINDKVSFTFSDTSYQANLTENGQFEVTFDRDSSEYANFVHGERTRMYVCMDGWCQFR